MKKGHKIAGIMIAMVSAAAIGLAGCGSDTGKGTTTVDTEKTTQSTEQTTEQTTQQTTQQKDTTIHVYVSNANADDFEVKNVVVDAITPENIVAALAANKVIPEQVKLLSFKQDKKSLTLNLSKEYQEYVQGFGTAGEMMAVGGVVNTFLDAYGAENITILVEGGSWDSGHTEYEGPLGRFELP